MLRNNKKRAFTLAELMVIMSVLTVLMAAFAPIVTSRYTMSSTDAVWSSVPEDSKNDIYSDAPSKDFLQSSFIGVTPKDGDDVKIMFGHLPSKLIVRSTDKLSSGNQKQLEFRYNDQYVGSLFSINESILFGANFDISANQAYNTSLGIGAFNKVSSSKDNVVLGYEALSNSSSSSSSSVVVGYKALKDKSVTESVAVGNNINSGLSYSVSIGNDVNNASGAEEYGVNIGDSSSAVGNSSVAIGYGAHANGDDNVSVGYNAMNNDSVHTSNTAVGFSACSNVSGSNKTCIGTAGGISSVNSDDVERVFIGGPVSKYNSSGTLEVHNQTGTTNGFGNESVIINGNLVVRGQPYMYGVSRFNNSGSYTQNYTDALMGYYVIPNAFDNQTFLFAGDDGHSASRRLYSQKESEYMQIHSKAAAHESCVCDHGLTSYDWSLYTSGNSSFTDYILYEDGFPRFAYSYVGNESNSDVELNRAHGLTVGSCCPILSQDGERYSDSRLKNVEYEFTSGLDAIKKLKFYNYTFKTDKLRTPQVGVIAQSLKKVFPISVSVDDRGYYKIRWDEMFYSSINSVKELNNKTNNLISRVEKDIQRIEKLKKDNQRLKNKLIELSKELDNLEK